jgi:hypothetical protein
MSELAHARSPYHYGEKNPEIIKDKKNEDHTNFTSSVAFIQHQAKNTKKQQKPYLLSLGRPNLLKTKNPKNPNLSKA